MNEFEIIYGVHSIRAALENPQRLHRRLIGSDEGIKELFKGDYSRLKNKIPEIEVCSSHKVQEYAKKYCDELEFHYTRVPSQVFLICDSIELKDANWLYDHAKAPGEFRILALDGVSDIHNGAAIMRTASFYGIDALIISGKSRFGFSPSLFRIASGAVEYLNIVQVQSLAKTLAKLKNLEVQCIGLSEHADENLSTELVTGKDCLVMGTEDVGLSHAVERLMDRRVSLPTQGKIQSLNVSVATAVTLEKCFGKS